MSGIVGFGARTAFVGGGAGGVLALALVVFDPRFMGSGGASGTEGARGA
jgi:hypothetical protein